jgi:hypothetical protein
VPDDSGAQHPRDILATKAVAHGMDPVALLLPLVLASETLTGTWGGARDELADLGLSADFAAVSPGTSAASS